MWLYLVVAVVSSFAAGWVVHWVRARGRIRKLQNACREKIRAAEEQLALERLRMEQRYEEAMRNGGRAGPEPSYTLSLYRDGHLARPRNPAPDSSTPRA